MIKSAKIKKSAQLLKEYRETEIQSFLLKHELTQRIENFTYDSYEDYHIAFEVFLNDSGKYIVFRLYDPKRFSDEFVKNFCKEFNVTLVSITREVTTYEDLTYEHTGLVTYLFEIIKGE